MAIDLGGKVTASSNPDGLENLHSPYTELDLPGLPTWLVAGTYVFCVLSFGAAVFLYFLNLASRNRSYIKLNCRKYTKLSQRLHHEDLHSGESGRSPAGSPITPIHQVPAAFCSQDTNDSFADDDGIDLGAGLENEYDDHKQPVRRRHSTGNMPGHREARTPQPGHLLYTGRQGQAGQACSRCDDDELCGDADTRFTPTSNEDSSLGPLSSSRLSISSFDDRHDDLNVSLLSDDERGLYLEMSSSIDESTRLDDSDVWSEEGGGWWLVQRAAEGIDVMAERVGFIFDEEVKDPEAGLLLPVKETDRETTESLGM